MSPAALRPTSAPRPAARPVTAPRAGGLPALAAAVVLGLFAPLGCAGELGAPRPGGADVGARDDADASARADGASGAADAGARDAATPDASAADPCAALACPTGARCTGSPRACACPPGFVVRGPACVTDAPGSPDTHTEAEVCATWRAGHAERAAGGGFTKSDASCDPGALSRDGLDDALRRLNMHRWLAGLAATRDDDDANARAQACALVSAWNPVGPQAHSPMPGATCYTEAGAAGAGSSNIAWGNGTAASAIDQWMIDLGNDTTFGHRRWQLNPTLSDVGIGAYVGCNNYGSSSCLGVFGMSGPSTGPRVIAYPPPGFVPSAIADWTWTVQGELPSGVLTVEIRAASTDTVLEARVVRLDGLRRVGGRAHRSRGLVAAGGRALRRHAARRRRRPVRVHTVADRVPVAISVGRCRRRRPRARRARRRARAPRAGGRSAARRPTGRPRA
jgi:hypothetical protein